MLEGAYIGHHIGRPMHFKYIDNRNIAFAHEDPDKIIWCYIIKFVLTIYAIEKNILHIKGGAVAYKGKSFLFLGRGGSGKTEIIRRLCKNGASFMANTHILVDQSFACGIKSNLRIREEEGDSYYTVEQLYSNNVCDGWLPIGGIFWVKYRDDKIAFIKKLSPLCAFHNLRWFTEAIANWEMKEDIADYLNSDPLVFAKQLINIDHNIEAMCKNHPTYYLNLDIFSDIGLKKTISLMNSCIK